ncbi:MAG: hypothetical protein Kow006_12380 [Gammaproteobacteria bacterium]
MESSANHLQAWLDRLGKERLPVLRQSRDALRELVGRGSYNGSEMTRNLAHDPLLCMQLLRLANQRSPDGRVATLEQAVVMCGQGTLETLSHSLPVLEERLPEAALKPLLQLYRFSFHVGYLARDLTRQKRDHHYNDAYFAGLLHSAGEILVRVFAPQQIPTIVRLAEKKKIPRTRASHEVLGFDLHQLSLAVARAWHLPALLQSALDEDHFQDKRTELVDLAADIMREGPRLLLPGVDNPLIERVALLLGNRVEEVKGVIFRANASAAAYLSTRLPDPRSDRFVDLFPSEPKDSFEGEPPPAPEARPETLERLKVAFRSSATEKLTPQRVLEMFTAAVREGLGLDRVVFALLSPDHTMLQGRFYGGVQANSALHHFEFSRDDKSIFARLMDRPAAFWLNKGNCEKMAPLLTERVRQVTGVEEFVAHSIFIADRPIGLCYADRGLSGKPITEAEYREFRINCQYLAQRLASLSAASAT